MNDQASKYDWPEGRPRITHMGINVIEMDKMVDFYTGIMGMTVSDRGFSERMQCNLPFMTSSPNTHHQVVLVDVREEGSKSTINQISFTLPSLAALRGLKERLDEAGVESNPICHGNAWSIYFDDPEGNLVETYLDAPFYVPQPQGRPYDLSLSDEEILKWTEEEFGGIEGFVSQEEWSAGLAKKMETPR